LHFSGTPEPRAMASVGLEAAAAGLMLLPGGAVGAHLRVRGVNLARLAGVTMALTLAAFRVVGEPRLALPLAMASMQGANR
jgi:hypothetical protein